MILQLYSYGRFGGFQNLMYWLDYWGIREVLIPFILVFAIVFAVLQKVHIFGKQENNRWNDRKINTVLAVAIALATIIPHSTGIYPEGLDVVAAINQAVPQTALLILAVVMVLVMLGLVGGEAPRTSDLATVIAIGSAIILGFIFLSGIAFPYSLLDWIDPTLLSLIIFLLVFALIVWFVSRDEGQRRPPGESFVWTERVPRQP